MAEPEEHCEISGDGWQVAGPIREAPLASEVVGINPADFKSPTGQAYQEWASPHRLAHLSTVAIWR
jgi:hypothetical protein